ncbi:hypothetical protein ACHAWF_001839 [Thalassiosira exigua]
MSDASTAPTPNRQLVRASVLVGILSACVFATKDGAADGLGGYRHELALLHLLSFSSWFGCSVWVSFVAGLVMFRNLPRHVFGRLQARLFPAYFLFSAVAVVVAIASASALEWDATPLYAVLITILVNLVYLEPETTRVMFERHAVERRLGTGHEVGQLKPKDPEKANDPELKRLSKKFGALHGMSTLMNLAALGVGCWWLNFCARQMMMMPGQ